jgi:hypothetical protein
MASGRGKPAVREEEHMRSPFRYLFNPSPRRPRGGTRPDPFFADPSVVEDDYIRFRRTG